MKICVYCSSSNVVDPQYFQAADEFGTLLAQGGHVMVFGGGSVGLMGALAKAIHANGGKIIGVIPEALNDRGVGYADSDEFIIVKTLRERKAIMESNADAFVALPGGFGTLEEVLEIITSKQLQYHAKPVVFLNTTGFYNSLFAFFEQLFEAKFVRPEFHDLYHVAETPHNILDYVANYKPIEMPQKWTW